MASAVQTAAPDLTAQGTIVGTFQYMAPEQLEAKEADARTDIFAFGAVLYEMLTGRKAFEGKSQASLIAAILEHEPPSLVDAAATDTRRARSPGENLSGKGPGRAVAECQRPRARARLDCRLIAFSVGRYGRATAGQATIPCRERADPLRWCPDRAARRDWPYAIDDVGTAACGDITSVAQRGSGRSASGAAADQTLSFGHLSRPAIALSPDGQTLVFTAVQGTRQQLYVRPLAQLEATPLPGTDGAMSPFFSPDGQSIGFWADGALKRISLGGGAPTTLCATELIFGASWGTTDVVVFARDNGGLWKVSARGGTPVAITTPDAAAGEVSHRLPQLLPGDEAVMFTVTRTLLPTWDDTQIVIQPLAARPRTLLVDGGADARYIPTGHIIYMRRGVLLAAPFDLAQRRVTEAASPSSGRDAVREHDQHDARFRRRSVQRVGLGLARVRQGRRLRLSRAACSSGSIERAGSSRWLLPARAYNYPRLSPDGNRVAVSTQGDRNIWMYDIGRGTTARVTVDGRNMAPAWTPDGIRLTFGSSAGGQENLFWQTADGSGAAERLTTSPFLHRAGSWSPDGRVLVFVEGDASQNGRDIMILEAGKVRPFLNTRFDEQYPEFSPDGHWIAYSSNESGRVKSTSRRIPARRPRADLGLGWALAGVDQVRPRADLSGSARTQRVGSLRSDGGERDAGSDHEHRSARKLFETPMGPRPACVATTSPSTARDC